MIILLALNISFLLKKYNLFISIFFQILLNNTVLCILWFCLLLFCLFPLCSNSLTFVVRRQNCLKNSILNFKQILEKKTPSYRFCHYWLFFNPRNLCSLGFKCYKLSLWPFKTAHESIIKRSFFFKWNKKNYKQNYII